MVADWLELQRADTAGVNLPRVPHPPCLPLPEPTIVRKQRGSCIDWRGTDFLVGDIASLPPSFRRTPTCDHHTVMQPKLWNTREYQGIDSLLPDIVQTSV